MDKKKVLFVTLEDSIETVMQRFDSLFSNLDFIIFRKDPDKSKTLLKKVEKHKNLLYIKDFTDGNFSVSKLSSIISSMKDIDIIILDYLDEIATVSKRDSRWQEVEDAARELKALAIL